MKIRLAVPALAAFLMVPAVWAQTGGAAAAGAEKVGVIDVQVAITSTSEGKQAAAELQSQFAPRQTELTNMQKQMEDIQTRTGQTTLSDDEKARLAREGDQLQRSYQRKSQDAQDDFNEAQREIVDRIGRKMIDVLSKYSRDNGYSVILDRSGQSSPVIFAANSIDVTQEIIRLYDQTYPAKSGSTTRPPAQQQQRAPAPKPQTPQQ